VYCSNFLTQLRRHLAKTGCFLAMFKNYSQYYQQDKKSNRLVVPESSLKVLISA